MQWHQVLGFVAAVIPLTLIPGTSLTLVTQQVIAGSRADGVLVTLGSAGGLLVHAACAAVGLSALVMSSAQALTVVKLLGGGYLVWLGVTTWRAAGREAETGVRRRTRWRLPWARLGGFAQGLWSLHWGVVRWQWGGPGRRPLFRGRCYGSVRSLRESPAAVCK
ncbi:LysE family translocator [Streptomyces rimosus]|uniref:LysE family translocator n=1 Tax=Streptomyces rimosus TaxID=1927 RepID=UPI0037CE49E5